MNSSQVEFNLNVQIQNLLAATSVPLTNVVVPPLDFIPSNSAQYNGYLTIGASTVTLISGFTAPVVYVRNCNPVGGAGILNLNIVFGSGIANPIIELVAGGIFLHANPSLPATANGISSLTVGSADATVITVEYLIAD